MRYPHILSAIRSAKWAVQPATLQAIRDVLSSRLAADAGMRMLRRPRADLMEHVGSGDEKPTEPYAMLAPGVACVRASGIIAKHLSGIEAECGGLDLDTVESALALAHAAPGVAHIIFHLDTPGGTVTGVPELAARIRAWSATKPIYAYVDSLCASAGYWLASACSGIFATTTAELGSIGVYMAAIDESENWKQEGYRMVLVKAGERKAEGMRGLPIDEATVARWQAEVDEIYAMFTADVSARRPQITSESMQGQCFMGAAAVSAGLADDLVPGLPELVAALAPALALAR